ncbi:DUF349 domain-containing protein [Prevotella melaninogenica]|uniref:DUF349 domain-containing protein n=1 Tax=Prevotella melaninogenica TaxID=28132 RepID=UPI001C5FD573|nr:DUF349 domain-containing protein [Prevotella melaninogenica]MBW4734155.1 DUF349 domain-containing protein [Prevotella melaninogenica]MBW4736644.1 DUF349 domain-containing protein [Prevotella melaninogenica]MBW4879257.1 DUF349 domain-containing protein [Prevotella melaninogenica]
MMDSQENALNQGTEEVKLSEEVAANATTENSEVQNVNTDAVEENLNQPVETKSESEKENLATKTYSSKKEIIERLKAIVDSNETPEKAEVEHLKTVFYKLHFVEREAQQKAYLENGGDPEKYQVLPDEDEEIFKAEMTIIKEKRQKAFLALEEEKQQNLKKKEAIIEQIKAMATTPEEANKNFDQFKKLQHEWKEIKMVPAEKANELWRNYQLYVEQFYDLLNLNREAREYDFKKNLEKKTKLCEAAEKLAEETDVISAFHQLQELHQEYRETGPVAKELREQIWARFKAASTVINKRHQQHFETLRTREEENLTKKTALCEKAEELAKQENKSSADWEKRTKEIIAIQQEWKTIGFAPQKMNVKIFERFRAACDDFFGRKGEFFKQLKEQFAENTEKKKALVEKAQALSESTDWKATSDKLIALQKEWKTIGMVPKKIGDQLWNDFLAACNRFFEARNAVHADSRNEEHENLDKKRDIISQLKELVEQTGENLQEKVQKLTEQYNKVGHVPYKEKDKLYKDYHEVLDKIYKDLHISAARKRVDNFRNNLKKVADRGVDALDNERGRLLRRFEQLKQEVNTYENNLGFLNISSKKGNSLIDEMNRRIQKLKDDMDEVKQKIKAIDAENK